MIGRMARGIARKSIARTLGGAGIGGSGLLPETLAAALPVFARRLSPVAMLALAAGGLVARRILVRRDIRRGLAQEQAAKAAGEARTTEGNARPDSD